MADFDKDKQVLNEQEYSIDFLQAKIKQLVDNKSIRLLREFFEEYPIADLAQALESLDLKIQLFCFRTLKTDIAAEVFSYLEDDAKTKLVHSFTEEWGMEIIQELQSDELADLLEDLPVNLTRKILAEATEEKREKVNSILTYSDDQVGSIMSVDISILKSNWTCKKALRQIKRDYKKNAEMSHSFYITDEKGIFLGSITLEELVFNNDEDDLLEDLYTVVATVHPYDDKEDAAQIFSEHDRSTLPVVSKDNFLIGMITSDDVIDVIQEEATEDMYKLAGINPEGSEEGYLKTSILKIVKSRVFWLIILMISATISQYIIQKFTDLSEDMITMFNAGISTAVIVSLIPIISGSAGNAGSQSSTTITRASALGEIEDKDLKRVIGKEIAVGAVIGVILFIVNVIRLFIYFAIFKDNTRWVPIIFVILASSLSLFLVVILSKFLGTIIPILAIKFKKDPAVMSAPILATLSDAISTLIFFGINILFLYIGFKSGVFHQVVAPIS